MPNNIVPADCNFGTADLDGDTGDVFPSAVWSRMGSNTGFLQHDPHMLWAASVPNDADVFPSDYTGYVYMARGTYTIYTGIYLEAAGPSGTLSINGTTLVATGTTHTETDTGFVVSSDSYGTFLFDLNGANGDAGITVRGRRESY